MKLIDKDALVAEIDEGISLLEERYKVNSQAGHYAIANAYDSKIAMLNDVKKILDTLEVKEVDLDKEVNEVFFKGTLKEADKLTHRQLMVIAKHFFELGLKVNNEKEK